MVQRKAEAFATWFLRCILLAVPLLGGPLVGTWLSSGDPSTYWTFPPLPQVRAVAPFSWGVFIPLFLLLVAMVGPVVIRISRSNNGSPPSPRRHLPWWGWLGLTLTVIFWCLAWTRQPWFAPLQRYTFTPLWLGYVIVVNALCLRRRGHCILLDRPGYFLALFPTSAALWTVFEYLNQFVSNWYYPGYSEITTTEYLLRSSLPFSTVLPAVLGTTSWLQSYPRLSAGLNSWRKLSLPSAWPSLALVTGILGLIALGTWPDLLYPLLWIAPLLLVWALQAFHGQETPLSDLTRGDWRSLWLPALAALLCGFCWELWNAYSLAHWSYTIPGAGRFYLFEMPLLGYGGYLPFGLFCVAVVEYLFPGAQFGGSIRNGSNSEGAS